MRTEDKVKLQNLFYQPDEVADIDDDDLSRKINDSMDVPSIETEEVAQTVRKSVERKQLASGGVTGSHGTFGMVKSMTT